MRGMGEEMCGRCGGDGGRDVRGTWRGWGKRCEGDMEGMGVEM